MHVSARKARATWACIPRPRPAPMPANSSPRPCCGVTPQQAGKLADAAAHAAQHVLRLQHPAAGETRAHMERVEPCHPDESERIRRRRRLRWPCLAKDEPEIRSDGGKILPAPEGDVHLQRVLEQKDTEQVSGRASHPRERWLRDGSRDGRSTRRPRPHGRRPA